MDLASSAPTKKLPIAPIAVAFVVVLGLVGAAIYLSKPAKPVHDPGVTPEAKAYLSHLSLSHVSMLASENFMQQQVIEVTGKITDNGSRALRSVEVYCLFYGVNGREIHRERLPIIQSGTAPLLPGETRSFRLPFDAVPDGWNQTLPKMVIAQITFAS